MYFLRRPGNYSLAHIPCKQLTYVYLDSYFTKYNQGFAYA